MSSVIQYAPLRFFEIYIYIYESSPNKRVDPYTSRFTNINRVEPSVYMSMYHLIIEPSFVFTNNPFNNRVEYELSLIEPIPNKLANSSTHLHPYME
jgi:hypothetical protein